MDENAPFCYLNDAMQLADYLAKRNLTHSEFAALIGTSQATVSRYVAGLRFPGPKILQRIQQATGGKVMPNDFLAINNGREQLLS